MITKLRQGNRYTILLAKRVVLIRIKKIMIISDNE